MILVGALRLKFLQCVDMGLINFLERSLCKCSILALTSMPFTQGTVNLGTSVIFSQQYIYDIKENTNGCSSKRNHRSGEFWFQAGFMTRNEELWVHFSERVCFLEELFT